MIQLTLSTEEAAFLDGQLARHVQEVEDELIHTDEHDLRQSLAGDLHRLRRILGKLEALIDRQDAIG